MDLRVLIPAYEPTHALSDLVAELVNNGLQVVIVNDGSSSSASHFFSGCEGVGALVLNHSVNLGKGAALKTGFRWMKQNDVDLVVTVDADGQHKVRDILNVAKRAQDLLRETKKFMVLGSRFADGAEIPFKSKLGNRLSSLAFIPIAKKFIRDTQTGLRALPYEMYDQVLSIPNNKYSLESRVLIEASAASIPIIEVDIETVYHDSSNSCSHFDPIFDSLDVYWVFIRYLLNGFFCYGIDLFIFFICISFTSMSIMECNLISRCAAFPFYYWNNRHLVFKVDGSYLVQIGKLVTVILAMGILSAEVQEITVHFLSLEPTLVKLISEIFMFPINFLILKTFVFTSKKYHLR